MSGLSWGPRGYPGSQGLKGSSGQKGDTGDTGQGATVTNNGDGTVTITGANGSVIVSDGKTPVAGVDYFPGASGDYLSIVYGEVLTGSVTPTITSGTGTYDGTNETMPTGSITWQKVPPYQEGYTTYVAFNRYIHDATTGGSGTWTLLSDNWSAPTVYQVNTVLSAKFTSYVFQRNSSVPTTPTGGSYDSPVPAGWSDGVPSGALPVYVSKRLFTENGQSPQDAAWSTPVLSFSDGAGTKLQFGPSSSGPWDDIPESTDEWMITCTKTAGGSWVCDTANPVKITGETGPEAQSKYLATAFKRSDTDLSALNAGQGEVPEGGSFDVPYPVDNGSVSGWTSTIPAGSANLYISNRLFTTDGLAPQDANWSGAKLFDGANAANFVVSADSQVFAYAEDGSITPSSITFTVNKQNIGNDTNWTTTPDSSSGIAADATAVETYTITSAEFDALSLASLKVTATAGSYTDAVTIAKVTDGSAALTGLLTNEVDSVFADVTGDPTFAGDEGGEFLVYIGALDAVSDCTFSVNGGTSQTKNGLNMAINATTGVYTVTESGSWTTDRETFDLVATYGPTSATVTKSYTLTKSKEGAVGAQGTSTRIDIAYGTSGSGGSVNYPALTFNPRTYTSASSSGKTFLGTNAVTWEPNETPHNYGEPGVSGVASDYEWTEIVGADGANGTDGTDGLSTRLDIAYADSYSGGTASGNLQFPSLTTPPLAATAASTNEYIGTDVVTWTSTGTQPTASQNQSTYEWTKYKGDDGTSGVDSLSISLTNSSHSVPCDSAGSPLSYDNSGTLVSVREGVTSLNYVSGTPGNGQWTVSTSITGGITIDSSPGDVGNEVAYGSITNWTSGTGSSSLTAKITFTANGKTLNGTSFSGLVAEQTFSKSIGGGGSPTSSIVTAKSGLIHNTAVLASHAGLGNSVTINWSVDVSSFPPPGGDLAYGDDPPLDSGGSRCKILVKRNGTTLQTVNLDVTEVIEDDGDAWLTFASNSVTSTPPGSGTYSYTIEWDGDTSGNTLTGDNGYISVVEDL